MKISLLLAAPLFLTLSFPALAQTATPTSAPSLTPSPTSPATRKEFRQETREEIRELKDGLKQDHRKALTTIAAEKKSFWTESRRQRLQAQYQIIKTNVTHRFQILSDYKTKIESKIEEKVKSGQNLDAAKTKLAEFSSLQSTYNQHLSKLDTLYQQLSSSEKPLTLLPDLKSAHRTLVSDLNSMKRVLVETLRLIVKAN
jgi:hypothetical protein